jgi:5'-nucleotidase
MGNIKLRMKNEGRDKMRLLLTNDDGINAPGLLAMANELEKYYEIVIVAPDNQRSASGHSITIARPIVAKEVKLEGIKGKAYSLDGTPADCTRIGVDKLSGSKIDMVVSGINKGLNLGTDVLYSGTVSAAVEAAIYNIPSIAVSVDIDGKDEPDYRIAATYGVSVLKKAIENKMEKDVVLNVNVPLIPPNDIKGIKVCKIGARLYDNTYSETITQENHMIIEIKAHVVDKDNTEADTYYLKEGYVTVTPLHYDLTNFKLLTEVNKWF